MELIEKWVGRISAVLASAVLLAMMLQIVVDVFMRTFVGAGIPATADLVSRYWMVAISFVPLAMTEIHRRHIEATIFTEKLSGMPQKIIAGFGFVVGLLVFLLLTWGTAAEAMKQTARGAYVQVGVTEFSTWLSYWILPVAFGLMCLILVIRLAEVITGQFDLSAHDPLEELQSKLGSNTSTVNPAEVR
ncbi:TRAP transporter small permease [Donghicola mangrovi]|uniref:TRAP transporter small permease protein n=1 Tax=Donghicola mangrovi TaxID=2729614 RepID=A0A850QBD8_9RHOB|nr:TRAP transporter small permease subunit [Donghicola mangrovi]NVO25662.1 TRAP transporter small permease [Donghicola mangrovi]